MKFASPKIIYTTSRFRRRIGTAVAIAEPPRASKTESSRRRVRCLTDRRSHVRMPDLPDIFAPRNVYFVLDCKAPLTKHNNAKNKFRKSNWHRRADLRRDGYQCGAD